MGTKNNPGKYDCYDKADPDEPLFTLRARDPLAPELVRMWADLRQSRAELPISPEYADKLQEARACADAMEHWRARNC